MSGFERLRWSFCLGVVLAAWSAVARAQVSPGPLANAHRELDSPLQCYQCHEKGGGPMEPRCLACHTEVAAMKTRHRGFHARVNEACVKCHPDHGGRDFALVVWDEGVPEKFDHHRAGWALEGKHAALECRACHKPALQRSAVTKLIRVRDHSKSWLGLETACASCHTDPHRGQLGLECRKCHDLKGWKPAPLFDHQKTAYALIGKHADVPCAKCHLAPALAPALDAKGVPVPQYKPLPHADCNACHRDPHVGRFGKTCASCHTVDNFENIRRTGFNHDMTRYPLRGRHATLECASCHDPKTAWGKKPLFAACGSCHKDAHAGQATIAGKSADCAACHKVEGYHPSTFTVAQHRLSKYPLEGRHVRVECSACHSKRPPGAEAVAALGASRVQMRPPYVGCTDCHFDPHQSRFSLGGERSQPEGCLSCHSLAGFRPSRVDLAMHAKYRFALEGAHRAVPCQACHGELKAAAPTSTLRAAAGARVLRFSDSRRTCVSCHETPHGDQFAARKDQGACESCHGQDAFIPADRFDHQRDAAFKLDGAHQRVACAACHRTERLPSGRARVTYRPVPSRCVDCHDATPPPPPRGSSRMETPDAGASDSMRFTMREVVHALIVH